MKNLAAFTAISHPYPPFISVNLMDDTQTVRISVRTIGDAAQAWIDLTLAEYHTLCHEMFTSMPVVPDATP